jgi:FlaA1/EpsC-like NDP-sugar epimerase
MGASKRVCELVILARAAAQKNTMYSAVRFGNVLGSSGSVVPLFRRQIAAGGPVTITHRDATRYFMTIPEAAQLVVQAGAMAEGGDIFLLDMGETVRIYDLAKMMIQLSGLSAVGEDGADGDIEIEEIGLRPGEKLHEELLIEDRPFPTSHPRIVKAREAPLPSSFDDLFALLLKAMEQRHVEDTLSIVEQLISLQTDDVKTVETAASSPAEGSKSSRTRRNYRRSTSTPKPAFGA